MKIAFGCDHAGIQIKDKLISFIKSLGHDVIDCGTNSGQSCDYPDFALKVSQNVISKLAEKGILICGTGIGMSIAANKVKGIRCARITNSRDAKETRIHNNANVVAFSARMFMFEIKDIVDNFLKTEYKETERFERRINKISKYEGK